MQHLDLSGCCYLVQLARLWAVSGIWDRGIDLAGLVEVVRDILGWQDQDLWVSPSVGLVLAAEAAAAALSGQNCRGQWVEHGRHSTRSQTAVAASLIDPLRVAVDDYSPAAPQLVPPAYLHHRLPSAYTANLACTSDLPAQTHRYQSPNVSWVSEPPPIHCPGCPARSRDPDISIARDLRLDHYASLLEDRSEGGRVGVDGSVEGKAEGRSDAGLADVDEPVEATAKL